MLECSRLQEYFLKIFFIITALLFHLKRVGLGGGGGG